MHFNVADKSNSWRLGSVMVHAYPTPCNRNRQNMIYYQFTAKMATFSLPTLPCFGFVAA
jgi:hypothetical protein